MKVVIAGGTGFIGRALSHDLATKGNQVMVLSRNPATHRERTNQAVSLCHWNPAGGVDWEKVLEKTDVLVNLVGESVATARWTKKRKQQLTESRVNTTSRLVQAMSTMSNPPRILVNASGIGFYGPQDDAPVNEHSAAGAGFMADLSVAWEREALKARDFGIRVALLRIGLVLGKDGGALQRMIVPFKAFAGGPILPGNQWVSWIHIQDIVELIHWIMTHDSLEGPINATAPSPVTMQEFCNKIGLALHRPSWLPVPQFALRMLLGELSSLMTTGQRVEPAVAMNSGYCFKYPTLQPALADLLTQEKG